MPSNPGTEYKINQIEVNEKPHSYWKGSVKKKKQERKNMIFLNSEKYCGWNEPEWYDTEWWMD